MIGTEPKEGAKVDGGSTVTLLVSKGANLAAVPDVVGLDQQIAENQIKAVGPDPQRRDDRLRQPEGTVVRRTPRAGARSRRGSEVTIVVSTGRRGR